MIADSMNSWTNYGYSIKMLTTEFYSTGYIESNSYKKHMKTHNVKPESESSNSENSSETQASGTAKNDTNEAVQDVQV